MKSKLQLSALKPLLAGPVLPALMLFIAAWLAWSGWTIFNANRLLDDTAAARRETADRLQDQFKSPLQQLARLKDQPELIAAHQRGELDTARKLIAKSLPTTEAVEFFAVDLNFAYADPAAFGYGKLGLLEKAAQDHQPVMAVIKEAGAPRLAMVAPIAEQNRLIGFIYLRLPLEPIKAAIQNVPVGGYLALRQGNYDIAEAGSAEGLQSRAEVDAIKFEGTPFRVVAAAPMAKSGLFGWSGIGEWLAAVMLALLGLALWRFAPKWLRVDQAAVESPTLAQMQSTGQIVAPTPSPALLKTLEEAQASPRVALNRNIFRAYDIRGVVGKTLDIHLASLIGQAIGSVMVERRQRSVVVGRDGRLSSPSLAQALIEGLRKAGCDVVDLGQAPTPLVYFGLYHLRTGCGVAVTGSHNPPDYNGFKIVIEGETLAGDAILDLYQRIADNRLHFAENLGQVSQRDLKADYINRIAGDVQIERKLKVVIDCGSGVAGALAPELLQAIGAEVEPLYCEVDGTFPHHHPDPSDPANMQDLIRVVQRVGADLGLALDGDGDRLGVVTRSGEMIYPDRLLMLFAADVLERNPGACIIYDVKCTGHLASQILRHGGSPLMWKTGHSLIKAKMKQTEAELAGEMSGHFFFRERWYGFDDGLYAAARLLEILAARSEDADAVFATLPKGVSTPELKVELFEGEQYRFIEKFLAQAKFEGARLATIDGLRADWPDGWGLVRASNTTPVLVLRFEGKDASALARIQALFREQLLAVDSSLKLPF